VAEAEYTTATRVPIDRVWDFVQEMDNWGRFVTGYQKHEKQSDVDSTWTLKGNVGVLSRTLTFQVKITEWSGPGRVSFTLDGVNEPMRGEGTFTLSSETGDRELGEGAARLRLATRDDGVAAAVPGSPRKNFLFRLLEAFWRWVLRVAGGGAPARDADATQGAAAGDTMTRLRFRLRLSPGGPMAPMVEAMIRPLLMPAAEDLANRILAQLESAEEKTA
jgi:carbon monoxide dehydrogenase subunit G